MRAVGRTPVPGECRRYVCRTHVSWRSFGLCELRRIRIGHLDVAAAARRLVGRLRVVRVLFEPLKACQRRKRREAIAALVTMASAAIGASKRTSNAG